MTQDSGIPVLCRFCGSRIDLNPDNENTRANGSDPLQQCRRHLAQHGMEVIGRHARDCGWLLDLLAYMPANPADRIDWRDRVRKILDYYLNKPLHATERPTSRSNPPTEH